MKSNDMDADVLAYFDAVDASRRVRLEALHNLIVECFPDVSIDMKYKMPTYTHGEGWVAIANQKSYVSLYTCSAAHLETFKARHPDVKTGKGCINFRAKDEIPVADVKEVVRHAMLHPKA